MKAVVWHGKNVVECDDVPKPLITEPHDAVVRITLATICGSDLHLLHNSLPTGGMKRGDILGHEGVGIVEEVGDNVKNIKKGDRVVISAIIAEGNCNYCKEGSMSLCDCTNPSEDMYKMFGGHRCAGVFGYSHLLGGYPGLQAQYARIPHADVNLLKLPSDVPDEKAIFLSDVLCTALHACEIGEVTEGKTVAIWGCGPIGLMAQKWSLLRGAKRVIAIDCLPDRLSLAENLGCEVINFKEKDPVETIAQMIPGGPDVCIECVGFRYSKSLIRSFEQALQLETDISECLDECIKAVKKNGIVSIIGDYVGYTNHFPIGIAMTKALTLRGSQVFVQKYWKKLLEMLQSGVVDPSFLISHQLSLENATDAYTLFDKKEQECLKILLRPSNTITKE